MKKKYLEGTSWPYLKNYESYHYNVEGQVFSLITFDEMPFKVPVDYDDSGKILLDDGSMGLMFMPDDRYCVSVVFNKTLEIQEWYFDMINLNGYDNKPFMMDLYLDVAVSPDRKAVILDEDELLEAFEKGIITASHLEKAFKTCGFILDELVTDDAYMVDFFIQTLNQLLSNKKDLKEALIHDYKQITIDINNFETFKLWNLSDEVIVVINSDKKHHECYDYMTYNPCLKIQKVIKEDQFLTQYVYPIRLKDIDLVRLLLDIENRIVTDKLSIIHFNKEIVFNIN